MKVIILYRPNSEFARRVEEFAHDIERQQGVTPQLVSMDTREGANMATTYDIVQQPTILITQENGGLIQMWTGENMPLMSEVAAYTHL